MLIRLILHKFIPPIGSHTHIKSCNMYDFYSIMKSEIVFNKFEVNDLLFVEYKCPLKQERVEIWSKYELSVSN